LGAGLSSSAALECAAAAALDDLFGLGLSRPALALVAHAAEHDFVGVPVGVMDQMASMLCTAGHALFLDARSYEVEQVPLDLAGAGLALLVIDTRAPHRLVDGAYEDRRRTCEDAARRLGVPALRDVADLPGALAALPDPLARRRVRHVVTENARVLDVVERLRAGAPTAVGAVLTASHESLRDDYEVSSPELDLAIDAALAAGALGARMTGGGFGGCAIALVRAPAAEAVRRAVVRAFAAAGYAAPVGFPVTPAPGAHRA
ncbi:MAG TPA: galactokinase, partial [Frankiaceae bacterium]|nr:galactokinase [Frankiaceae bacterium]